MTALIFIAIAGFAAQLVDGGLGMGFGVTSTTLLITFAALTPATASAVVHTAEVGTTFVSGLSHWRFGNVDWKVVAQVGVPGAIGAFAGATFLSHISTQAAQPVTAAILAAVGMALILRFSRGVVRRRGMARPHSTGFLGGLGVFGGFVDASGGGGWGPVTTSTLLLLGRNSPRRIVGTVNTAEFLVALAATVGFVFGLWEDLLANLAAAGALLLGGVIAAPIAAWLISRVNSVVLGGFVGTFLVVLNLPVVLSGFGVGDTAQTIVGVVSLVVGLGLSLYGARRAKSQAAATALEHDRVATVSGEPGEPGEPGAKVPAAAAAEV